MTPLSDRDVSTSPVSSPASSRRWPRIALPAFLVVLLAATTCARAATFEAETGVLSGAPPASVTADGTTTPPIGNPGGGVSGGYVFFDTSDASASLTFNINAASDGLYSVSLRFYVPNSFGDKFTNVLVDGVSIGETRLWAADSTTPVWATTLIGNLNLATGLHTITLQRDWGYYYIDYLTVDALPAPPVGLKFEAENGAPSGGASIDTANPGYSGTGYVTNFTSGSAKLLIPVNLANTGQYRVYVGYSTLGGPKNTHVLFNGLDLGEWTLPDSSTWAEAGPFTITANSGISVLEFDQDWGWYNIDYVRFEYVIPPVGTDFEAESGSTFRAQISTARPGFSGTGYVTNFVQSPDAYVSIPVNVATGGAYNLTIRAATPNGPKKARITVNGADFGEASFDTTTDVFTDFKGPTIFLRSGVNLITISADWGYYDVDKIHLDAVTIPPFNLNKKLVDKAAAPEAVALYNYLLAQFQKTTLAGQTEEPSTTPNNPFDRLLAITGKQPAIRDQDMIFQSSKGGWNDGTPDRGIAWNRSSKGIIAMQWHWFAPLGPTAFYTADSTFDVEQAVTPGTPENIAALADIDLIATKLGKYAANRVPILWRPLHEAEGGWFWWGAKGPGPAKALYRMMYDRLVNYNGLHNLIWVWNSVNPDWYPGDDVVDIVSADVYNAPHNYSPAPSTFLSLSQLGGYRKVVTLAENGPIPDPDDMATYKTIWSWFNTWNGIYIMDDSQNAASKVNAVYHDPRVITLDELPDLRPARAVTAFTDTKYSGTSIGLPPGDYLHQHLVARGATTGNIKSLKVPLGYVVVVYSGDNFTGQTRLFLTDFPNLSLLGTKEPVGSIRIRKL